MKRLVLFLFSILLNACSHFTVERDTLPAVANPMLTWQHNQTMLNNIERWKLTGKLSLITHKKSSTISIYWKQKNNNYHIELSAPLGQGDALITGDHSKVKIQTSEGKTMQDTNPQALLYKQFKLSIPINNLQYWIKGLPSPTIKTQELRVNPAGYLKSFRQNQWAISYVSYKKINKTLALPTEILFQKKQAKLKIFIKKWEKR